MAMSWFVVVFDDKKQTLSSCWMAVFQECVLYLLPGRRQRCPTGLGLRRRGIRLLSAARHLAPHGALLLALPRAGLVGCPTYIAMRAPHRPLSAQPALQASLPPAQFLPTARIPQALRSPVPPVPPLLAIPIKPVTVPTLLSGLPGGGSLATVGPAASLEKQAGKPAPTPAGGLGCQREQRDPRAGIGGKMSSPCPIAASFVYISFRLIGIPSWRGWPISP